MALPYPDPPLTDGVVRLRRLRRADLPALVEALRDEEIARWTTVPPGYTRAHAELWLERSEELRRTGEQLSLVVADGDDRLVGTISLIDGRRHGEPVELGYAVARWARGRGLGPRAVALLRDWGNETLAARRIELLIHVDNAPSRRLAEKAGFRDTGERRPPPRRCGPPGDPDHAVHVWERSGAEEPGPG